MPEQLNELTLLVKKNDETVNRALKIKVDIVDLLLSKTESKRASAKLDAKQSMEACVAYMDETLASDHYKVTDKNLRQEVKSILLARLQPELTIELKTGAKDKEGKVVTKKVKASDIASVRDYRAAGAQLKQAAGIVSGRSTNGANKRQTDDTQEQARKEAVDKTATMREIFHSTQSRNEYAALLTSEKYFDQLADLLKRVGYELRPLAKPTSEEAKTNRRSAAAKKAAETRRKAAAAKKAAEPKAELSELDKELIAALRTEPTGTVLETTIQ